MGERTVELLIDAATILGVSMVAAALVTVAVFATAVRS